ncbi:MAG: M17 family peptidase N-terminal domain-containing protein, partial [Nocardioidaceae bacterium]
MTAINLRKASAAATRGDALVIGIHSDGDSIVVADGAADVSRAFGRGFPSTLKSLGVSPKAGDVTKIPSSGATKCPVVVVAGLGPAGPIDLESLRRAAGAATRELAGAHTVVLALPAADPAQVRAVSEGALLGAYAYDTYLTKKHEPVGELVVLTGQARTKEARRAQVHALAVAEAVNFARDLINRPPNDLYPESFADSVKARARRSKVSVAVTDEKALEANGYGGIMGVGKGSIRPPRLVRLSYRPARAKGHLAFVGKGITFDTVGLLSQE